ncbi:uncharacterized protein [Rutidosis leptorrhynchoides]|uniref:uncharacterized protein n=1 Tax=Rutidosis leptorrhynchoides TaxID=125765 RepID=UPI003A98D162
MGDFNVSLSLDESNASSSSSTVAMRDFQDCVKRIHMSDVTCSGFQVTWNQKSRSTDGILKKIDRIMANDGFINNCTNSYAVFLPYRISDHCPAILKIPHEMVHKHNPFKFSKYIANHNDFCSIVNDEWSKLIHGHAMYRLVQKFKLLKKPIRKLMWSKGNFHTNVIRLRSELDVAQRNLDSDPSSILLLEIENNVLKKYNDAILEEERFLKQKSSWNGLELGIVTLNTFIRLSMVERIKVGSN